MVQDERIYLRATAEEKAAWSEKAKSAGMGLSEWLRSLANGGDRPVGKVQAAKPRRAPRRETVVGGADAGSEPTKPDDEDKPEPEKLERGSIKEHNQVVEDRKNRIWRDPNGKGRPCGECGVVEGRKHPLWCATGDRMQREAMAA